MPSPNIRRFTPDDYVQIVNVYNALFPDQPGTAAEWRENDARRDPQYQHARWVAARHNRIVGFASYGQSVWRYDPHDFTVAIHVLPDCQGQGIGSALYDTLAEALRPFDPVKLLADGYERHPQGIRFLEKRGFQEKSRSSASRLDVAAFDPTLYDGLTDRLRAQGIVIKSLREMEGEPDRDQRLYALDPAIIPDLPGGEALTLPPFEQWTKEVLYAPNVIPEAYFVALHGDTVVGTSNLLAAQAGSTMYQSLTAVRPDFRRRGIATALKVCCIAYAQAHHIAFIETDSDRRNLPMLAVNRRLGFVKRPDLLEMEKVCRERTPLPEPQKENHRV
jgi:mycothiol synthase